MTQTSRSLPSFYRPLIIASMIVILSSCTTYSPIVDTKGIDKAQYDTDLEECRAYADQVDATNEGVTNGAIGAVGGAAVGAILGALGGDAGAGAAMGTAVGGLGGGGIGASKAVDRQKTIINNCLKGRGYRILG